MWVFRQHTFNIQILLGRQPCVQYHRRTDISTIPEVIQPQLIDDATQDKKIDDGDEQALNGSRI
jgi:hypothetical protein